MRSKSFGRPTKRPLPRRCREHPRATVADRLRLNQFHGVGTNRAKLWPAFGVLEADAAGVDIDRERPSASASMRRSPSKGAGRNHGQSSPLLARHFGFAHGLAERSDLLELQETPLSFVRLLLHPTGGVLVDGLSESLANSRIVANIPMVRAASARPPVATPPRPLRGLAVLPATIAAFMRSISLGVDRSRQSTTKGLDVGLDSASVQHAGRCLHPAVGVCQV